MAVTKRSHDPKHNLPRRRPGRPNRTPEELAFHLLWSYANWLALHQWLHFWARLFAREVTEDLLSHTLIPLPHWVCRMGLGRFAHMVYFDAPSELVLELLCRRYQLKPHQIRWLLARARKLYPGLFPVLHDSSIFAWRLRAARDMGIRARPRASAAQRLAAALPAIDQEWRERTQAHFPPIDEETRRTLEPVVIGPLLLDDRKVNVLRFIFALRYAIGCLQRRAARTLHENPRSEIACSTP